ncbi:BTAD domain-containing putative transcriptional regulator [Sanguibacter sp. 25GB23B1]|uniref:AfsR/SARP family transcriptional regulator n=1 Tax=unclassified Sanguibacter TaxID=2645534 RepID=UPI0032AF8FF9
MPVDRDPGQAVHVGVLGPVVAWDEAGVPIALRGPRHRAVLARLVVARGRVVPVSMLVDDLWDRPPDGAVSAVRTFVAALRRALEPQRPPRAPARLLVTEGAGYALRGVSVDAVQLEDAVDTVRSQPPGDALATLDRAAALWRGPAYAELVDEHWARAERSRLAELRLHAVELRAGALLDLGRAADAIPDLDAHAAQHPWREEGWRLLALALYRTGRQGDALDVLRRARSLLADQLGVDPGPALRRLEEDVLQHARGLDLVAPPGAADRSAGPRTAVDRVWAATTMSYDRALGSGAGPGTRARLRSTVDLLRSLAVTGGSGLETAQGQRIATIRAAEELGDPDLTARIIGSYDVPAVWSRSDDPTQAAQVVAAAERALVALPADAPEPVRGRLLATIAVESRGDSSTQGRAAAAEAEEIARRSHDPALLAFALNGTFMQSFSHAGRAPQRDTIGAELVDLGSRHGLVTSELLGHLVRLQSACALGDLPTADGHAAAADALARSYESPLVSVFTGWYQALRLGLTNQPPAEVAAAYRRADALLDGAGMPGVRRGLLPLALLGLRVVHGRPAPTDPRTDWGPYAPWARPLVLLAEDRRDDAAAALRALPDPPHDHLLDALWCLAAHAAVQLEDHDMMERAHTALLPAAGEIAGAGSGLLTLGPVPRYLDALAAGLRGSRR